MTIYLHHSVTWGCVVDLAECAKRLLSPCKVMTYVVGTLAAWRVSNVRNYRIGELVYIRTSLVNTKSFAVDNLTYSFFGLGCQLSRRPWNNFTCIVMLQLPAVSHIVDFTSFTMHACLQMINSTTCTLFMVFIGLFLFFRSYWGQSVEFIFIASATVAISWGELG